MLRSKIIHSKPRSPSSYTSRRDNCDAEVIGIITLKAHGSSFQFISRKKHDWNTKQQLVRKRNPKKGNVNSHSFFTTLSQLAEPKKRRHVCSTLLPFMHFFAKNCSKASPPRTLVCALSVQL
ncbi:hypothetical protein AVEN_58947-1 [Araneus ventricosus]|uniref:Uncharacterized protein n=1 Tax=Araneus ventricosus TaxID=182803 RepID=A0A4Y2ES66_ARAVE|nr:hypothetical protein AVEN_58947-1 [Araneus ventricosus]